MQLQQQPVNRLLSKDISRTENLPGLITGGARETGIISVLFYANASAGDFTQEVTLNYETVPLSLVWFLGTADKNGSVNPGGGLVPGAEGVSTVVEGISVFSGAKAAYSIDKDTLTVGVTSTDVGWSYLIEAHFYYALYYDVIDYQAGGLTRLY